MRATKDGERAYSGGDGGGAPSISLCRSRSGKRRNGFREEVAPASFLSPGIAWYCLRPPWGTFAYTRGDCSRVGSEKLKFIRRSLLRSGRASSIVLSFGTSSYSDIRVGEVQESSRDTRAALSVCRYTRMNSSSFPPARTASAFTCRSLPCTARMTIGSEYPTPMYKTATNY